MEENHRKSLEGWIASAEKHGFYVEFMEVIERRTMADSSVMMGWVALEYMRLLQKHGLSTRGMEEQWTVSKNPDSNVTGAEKKPDTSSEP